MKTFLVLALLTFLVVTIVMAVFFRDAKAQGRLRFIRNAGWACVLIVLGLAAWSIYSYGL